MINTIISKTTVTKINNHTTIASKNQMHTIKVIILIIATMKTSKSRTEIIKVRIETIKIREKVTEEVKMNLTMINIRSKRKIINLKRKISLFIKMKVMMKILIMKQRENNQNKIRITET